MLRKFIIPSLLIGILLALPMCGKKGPPLLPQKEFPYRVTDLMGEWSEGRILLKGKILGSSGSKKAKDIMGCRVYYGQYPLENPPCDDCPIEYHESLEFGAEVITEKDFSCIVPEKREGQIYFFKVHLIGPEGILGPPS
ncbi:MAG: hypothetical protein JRJ65_14060, partial [Deltaproteobacteria bacterium]|nr:hypothetical protein [Deltaproteobacteria bacterium]